MASRVTANMPLVLTITWVLFCVATPVALHGGESQPEKLPEKLVVCALPAAMPRTGRAKDDRAEGLDIAVAQLVSQQLGRRLEVHWCASSSCSWNCLREGRCDVVLGQADGSESSRGVAWSVPYTGNQFGLVVPQDARDIRSLASLRDKRLGIVAGTVSPATKDHQIVRFKSRADVLRQFESKQLAGAFLDADFASWYLHAHPDVKLRIVEEYVPRERWNMALAVRSSESDLLVAINRALSQLSSAQKIQKVYADRGVAFREPFTNSAPRKLSHKAWKRIQERQEIVVSMDPANLPYSSASEELPGCDVELARAVATELGVKLRIEWIDVQRETAIGQLLEQECDLAFGAAIDTSAVEDEEELAGKVIYSAPYYGTGYLLVRRRDGPQVASLAELKGKQSRRLGTEAGSVADYHLRQRGYLRRLFRNQLAVLKSLDEGHIDHAYLWANVGWTLHTTPEFDLEIQSGYVPEDYWNIAIALRRGDDELKRHVDTALAKLIGRGLVSESLKKYHVPDFPPFARDRAGDVGTNSGATIERGTIERGTIGHNTIRQSTIRHSATDRGLEPQLYQRQRSRQRYGGLERIRSAGRLVVGLDHNNLPFSTAHPKPAGLDYEIAGLLAERLGVSLQIYWGYSSHDSYPSKLASKEFCDAMLGVMPDDRFGQRVIYSKPYYVQGYQMAVAADGDDLTELADPAAGPLAVEPGLALRSIRGREVQHYASLEEILAAVTTGEARVGYVNALRGRWLAETRWPGKLKFIELADSADKFPICVALRKTDGDLKTAIDDALDELAKSGQLAAAFARWHLPHMPSAGGG